MTLPFVSDFLLWCLLLNYAVLLVWAGVFIFAHDWMYAIHSRWFRIAPDRYDMMHFGALAVYKTGVLLFVLVPWIALQIVR